MRRHQHAAVPWILTGVSGAFVPSAGRTESLPASARAWPLSATPRKFQFWALASGTKRAMAHNTEILLYLRNISFSPPFIIAIEPMRTCHAGHRGPHDLFRTPLLWVSCEAAIYDGDRRWYNVHFSIHTCGAAAGCVRGMKTCSVSTPGARLYGMPVEVHSWQLRQVLTTGTVLRFDGRDVAGAAATPAR